MTGHSDPRRDPPLGVQGGRERRWPAPSGPRPRGPKDRSAPWALTFAVLLGLPLTLVMGVLVLLEGVQWGMCSPDYTCGGLSSPKMFISWAAGGLGFVGGTVRVAMLDRVDQRRARWLWAWVAVVTPVVVTVVAYNAAKTR
ncbi:MAG: hypothetical protein HOW97_36625 [Catenulispora sp.]|nr:hypothetical protein [Catenulispora sp.]